MERYDVYAFLVLASVFLVHGHTILGVIDLICALIAFLIWRGNA